MTDNTKKISVEGRTVAEAAVEAAKQLGVAAAQIRYELDLSHFKTPDGRRRPMDTVKITAWAIDADLVAGADFAKGWLTGLFETMGADAEVTMTLGKGKNARLVVTGKAAGRLSPAAEALNVLMTEVIESSEYAGWNVRVEVPHRERREEGEGRGRDDRGRDDRGRGRDDRGRDDRGRDDRGRGRDDRGRGRDDRGRGRDDRGRGRDRDDRGRGRGRREEGGRDEEREAELRKLALRLAQKVADTGGSETIRRSLNSYERRVVHMTVSDIDGVETESVEDDEGRRTVVIRAASAEASAD